MLAAEHELTKPVRTSPYTINHADAQQAELHLKLELELALKLGFRLLMGI